MIGYRESSLAGQLQGVDNGAMAPWCIGARATRYLCSSLFSRLRFYICVTDVSRFRQGLDFLRRVFK